MAPGKSISCSAALILLLSTDLAFSDPADPADSCVIRAFEPFQADYHRYLNKVISSLNLTGYVDEVYLPTFFSTQEVFNSLDPALARICTSTLTNNILSSVSTLEGEEKGHVIRPGQCIDMEFTKLSHSPGCAQRDACSLKQWTHVCADGSRRKGRPFAARGRLFIENPEAPQLFDWDAYSNVHYHKFRRQYFAMSENMTTLKICSEVDNIKIGAARDPFGEDKIGEVVKTTRCLTARGRSIWVDRSTIPTDSTPGDIIPPGDPVRITYRRIESDSQEALDLEPGSSR